MKIGILTLPGSLILLACMVFASLNLASADAWAPLWIPFVAAGVGLVVVGAIVQRAQDDRF